MCPIRFTRAGCDVSSISRTYQIFPASLRLLQYVIRVVGKRHNIVTTQKQEAFYVIFETVLVTSKIISVNWYASNPQDKFSIRMGQITMRMSYCHISFVYMNSTRNYTAFMLFLFKGYFFSNRLSALRQCVRSWGTLIAHNFNGIIRRLDGVRNYHYPFELGGLHRASQFHCNNAKAPITPWT